MKAYICASRALRESQTVTVVTTEITQSRPRYRWECPPFRETPFGVRERTLAAGKLIILPPKLAERRHEITPFEEKANLADSEVSALSLPQ
jgi:hypothetical protein